MHSFLVYSLVIAAEPIGWLSVFLLFVGCFSGMTQGDVMPALESWLLTLAVPPLAGWLLTQPSIVQDVAAILFLIWFCAFLVMIGRYVVTPRPRYVLWNFVSVIELFLVLKNLCRLRQNRASFPRSTQ